METNSKGKRMVFEEDIKYLQELKGEKISSKTVGRVVDTNNITTLSDEVCNALKCGDMVNKVDSTGKHSYRVSYKKDEGGMCLTYSDASCVETVSYDYTEGHWVYNSTDVTQIPGSSGGDQLYIHNVEFYDADLYIFISIVTSNNTVFTPATFFNYLASTFDTSLAYQCTIIDEINEIYKPGIIIVDTEDKFRISDGTTVTDIAFSAITSRFIDYVKEI